jgi:hypothetical protein
MKINDELVTWYNSSQTCPYTLQTVVQPDCCTTKFKPIWKSSNCCTKSQITTHDQIVCATASFAQNVWTCMGPFTHWKWRKHNPSERWSLGLNNTASQARTGWSSKYKYTNLWLRIFINIWHFLGWPISRMLGSQERLWYVEYSSLLRASNGPVRALTTELEAQGTDSQVL